MYKYMSDEYFSESEKVYIGKTPTVPFTGVDIHTHDFIEVVYIAKGGGIHIINGISYEVKKGDLLFINYGQTHEFTAGKNAMTIYNILIRPEFFSKDLVNSENAFELLSLSAFEELASFINKECPFVSLDGDNKERIEVLLEMLDEEYNGREQGRRTMINSLMMALMISIFRSMSPEISKPQKAFNSVASDILSYIETHFHEKISLTDLAERCFYTPSYFSRLFKETYSMTITEYIILKRIEKSKELLKNSDMTVEDICYTVGYTDKTKFYRHFKDITGKTPADYRKS